jgi:hypothetical protein
MRQKQIRQKHKKNEIAVPVIARRNAEATEAKRSSTKLIQKNSNKKLDRFTLRVRNDEHTSGNLKNTKTNTVKL